MYVCMYVCRYVRTCMQCHVGVLLVIRFLDKWMTIESSFELGMRVRSGWGAEHKKYRHRFRNQKFVMLCNLGSMFGDF